MIHTTSHRRRDLASRRKKQLERRIMNALTTVYDPATPNVDLFNLGMVYGVQIDEADRVIIELAFSSPEHPGNLELPSQVAGAVCELEGVSECTVRVVRDPAWTMDRVSDDARIHLSVVGEAN
jgi:metal-sulfur cluster biosynthetic enzyme